MTAKNNDIVLDITLQAEDLEDGTPGERIDFDSLAGCLIILYQNISKPLAIYSKVIPAPNPDGYKTISVIDGPEGEISILVPRAINKTMIQANYFIEVMISELNVDGEAGQFYTIATDILVDELKNSIGQNKTIPI